VPLSEVAVLLISNPVVTLTQAVLAGLADAGGVLVACDRRHMPAAMLLPLQANFAQAERFVQQTRVSLPRRKRLWQAVVKSKISAQGAVLRALYGDDAGLSRLAAAVRSGDTGNAESEAARRYWPRLFADPAFHRDREADDENRLLNYGYAVLRAIVARAVCAAGLHPSLGLHHHNRYNAFCLADDLMEPFRPIVDRAVVQLCHARGRTPPLDKEAKATLLGALLGRFPVAGAGHRTELRSLFDIASMLAASLVGIFAGERKALILPQWWAGPHP